MGNFSSSNRRSTSLPSFTFSSSWDVNNVDRMIAEHKLAPKGSAAEAGIETKECPICFLDFHALNTATCCKQLICTDCVVQIRMKEKNHNGCPFCTAKELLVTFSPEKNRKNNSLESRDPQNSTDKPGSINNLSYTTPEQERKLRSLSTDSADKSTGEIYVPQCTKSDRETLERQIREQRLQFDERDLAEHAAHARRATFSGGSGHRNFRLRTSTTYQQHTPSVAAHVLDRRSASNSPRTQQTFGGGATNRFAADSDEDDGNEHGAGGWAEAGNPAAAPSRTQTAAAYTSALENLLFSATGNTRITSIQQLEELMLLEAIRLSMEENQPAAAPATETTSTQEPSSGPPSSSSEIVSSASTNENIVVADDPNGLTPQSVRALTPPPPPSDNDATAAIIGTANTEGHGSDIIDAALLNSLFEDRLDVTNDDENGENDDDDGEEEMEEQGEENDDDFGANDLEDEEEEEDEEDDDEEEEMIRRAIELSLADSTASSAQA